MQKRFTNIVSQRSSSFAFAAFVSTQAAVPSANANFTLSEGYATHTFAETDNTVNLFVVVIDCDTFAGLVARLLHNVW